MQWTWSYGLMPASSLHSASLRQEMASYTNFALVHLTSPLVFSSWSSSLFYQESTMSHHSITLLTVFLSGLTVLMLLESSTPSVHQWHCIMCLFVQSQKSFSHLVSIYGSGTSLARMIYMPTSYLVCSLMSINKNILLTVSAPLLPQGNFCWHDGGSAFEGFGWA